MNRRQAKKKIKAKWRIRKGGWPRQVPARIVDKVYNKVMTAIAAAIERSVLYGDEANDELS